MKKTSKETCPPHLRWDLWSKFFIFSAVRVFISIWERLTGDGQISTEQLLDLSNWPDYKNEHVGVIVLSKSFRFAVNGDTSSVLVYMLNNSQWKCHTSSPVTNAMMANVVRPIATITLPDILLFCNFFVSDAGRNCSVWSKPLSYGEM